MQSYIWLHIIDKIYVNRWGTETERVKMVDRFLRSVRFCRENVDGRFIKTPFVEHIKMYQDVKYKNIYIKVRKQIL